MAGAAIFFTPSQMPEPWQDPGFNQIAWVQSPHYDARPPGAVIDTIVLHATANDSLELTTRWFMNPTAKVSAHFTIGKDGSIIQHVSTFERAWHAGPSLDKEGREQVNNFSVGIELVNLNDGKDPYPEPQVQALRNLVLHLKRRHPMRYIVSHEVIAVPRGRKSDPANFPWMALDPMGLEIVID
jgi:N-acetylmuramoyl-L-alanine amidase